MSQYNKIILPNFEFTLDQEKGWLWKAINIPFKKVVKEQPQFDVIYDIEKHYQNQFDKCLGVIVKQIVNQIK